jgi:hypothetical protein
MLSAADTVAALRRSGSPAALDDAQVYARVDRTLFLACAEPLENQGYWLQGNIAWDDEYCYIDDKFRRKVTESPGFRWVDEAKPHHFTKKEGFVATEPGAFLLLTVNTAETTQTDVRRPALPHYRSSSPSRRSKCTAKSVAALALLFTAAAEPRYYRGRCTRSTS